MPRYTNKNFTADAIEVTNTNITQVLQLLSQRGDISNIVSAASCSLTRDENGKSVTYAISFSAGQFVVEIDGKIDVMSKAEFETYFQEEV